MPIRKFKIDVTGRSDMKPPRVVYSGARSLWWRHAALLKFGTAPDCDVVLENYRNSYIAPRHVEVVLTKESIQVLNSGKAPLDVMRMPGQEQIKISAGVSDLVPLGDYWGVKVTVPGKHEYHDVGSAKYNIMIRDASLKIPTVL